MRPDGTRRAQPRRPPTPGWRRHRTSPPHERRRPDPPGRAAPPERRDHRPARVRRPRPVAALLRLDARPDRPRDLRRAAAARRASSSIGRARRRSPSSPPTRSSRQRSIAILQGILDQSGGSFQLIVMADEQAAVAHVGRSPAGRRDRRDPPCRAGSSVSASISARRWASSRSPTCRSVSSASPSSTTQRATRSRASSSRRRDLPSARRGRCRLAAGSTRPAFASRLIVGAVFGFLIFITIVIYGMWVAQGVVAEKSSRVMELLISAASTRQLVIGKALGIGLAGATQTTIVLAPALIVLASRTSLPGSSSARVSGSRRSCPRCRRGCCSRSPASMSLASRCIRSSTPRRARSSAGRRICRSSPCR